MTGHTFLVWSHCHETIFEAVLCIGSSSCRYLGMCTGQLLVFQLPEFPLRLMRDQLSVEGRSVFQEQYFTPELDVLAFWTWLHKCFAGGRISKRIVTQWNALLTKNQNTQ